MKTSGILIPDVEYLFEATLKEILKDDKEDSFEKLTENEKLQFIEIFDEKFINYFQEKATSVYSSFIESHLENQKRLSQIHIESYKHFCGYIKLCYDLFQNIRKRIDYFENTNNNKIIISQYGYLVRLADQIFAILLNGYQDGALRIWRSLYEYSAILLLLMREYENKEIFIRFINHHHRNQSRKIESYMKSYEILNFEKLDDELINRISRTVIDYEKKYGKDFLKNDYGWSTIAFNNTKVTFRDIEESVGLCKYRMFYIYASSFLHPSFDSMFDFFGDNQSIYLSKITEPTEDKKSIIDPLQLTVSILHEVNTKFLEIYCLDYEYDINLKLFRRVFEMMQKTFEEKE